MHTPELKNMGLYSRRISLGPGSAVGEKGEKKKKSCSLGRESSLVYYIQLAPLTNFLCRFTLFFFPFFPHSRTWCQAIGEYRSTCEEFCEN